jgi:hyperosmotically inducible periplasmic protein
MKVNFIIVLMIFTAAGCSDTANSGTVTKEPPSAGAVARDNTGVNTRDRDNTAVTPTDQKENKADIDVTANIRKRIVAAKVSVDAQNAKIVTRDGKVTLRGPVKTANEKQQLEQIATDVAGAQNVESQLEVKP